MEEGGGSTVQGGGSVMEGGGNIQLHHWPSDGDVLLTVFRG